MGWIWDFTSCYRFLLMGWKSGDAGSQGRDYMRAAAWPAADARGARKVLLMRCQPIFDLFTLWPRRIPQLCSKIIDWVRACTGAQVLVQKPSKGATESWRLKDTSGNMSGFVFWNHYRLDFIISATREAKRVRTFFKDICVSVTILNFKTETSGTSFLIRDFVVLSAYKDTREPLNFIHCKICSSQQQLSSSYRCLIFFIGFIQNFFE